MTFYETVIECSKNREFVEGVDRLRGTDFSALHRRDGLARAIDEATGRDRDRACEFAAIVYELVWCRLPRETQA